jgi:hypothetical protein
MGAKIDGESTKNFKILNEDGGKIFYELRF